MGYSTDVENDDVATSITAVAFGIGVVWKLLYDRLENR